MAGWRRSQVTPAGSFHVPIPWYPPSHSRPAPNSTPGQMLKHFSVWPGNPWHQNHLEWSFRLRIADLTLASLVAQMVKNLPAMQETQVWPVGWEDSPGEGNGHPLQYSFLGSPTHREAWQATVHGVAKESDTTERLTLFTESLLLKRKLGPLF